MGIIDAMLARGREIFYDELRRRATWAPRGPHECDSDAVGGTSGPAAAGTAAGGADPLAAGGAAGCANPAGPAATGPAAVAPAAAAATAGSAAPAADPGDLQGDSKDAPRPLKDRVAYLAFLGVAAAHRRRGVGDLLVERATSALVRGGAYDFVTAFCSSAGSAALLGRRGWSRWGGISNAEFCMPDGTTPFKRGMPPGSEMAVMTLDLRAAAVPPVR